MRLSKWVSLLLCLCTLSSLFLATLAEETGEDSEVVLNLDDDSIEITVDDAGDVEQEPGEVGELLSDADALLLYSCEDSTIDASQAESTDSNQAGSVAATEGRDLDYARITGEMVPLFFDDETSEAIAKLARGETVLIIGSADGLTMVAVNVFGRIMEGFIKQSKLEKLSNEEAVAYQAKIASAGKVALYQNDLDWPLGPLSSKSDITELEVMATYTKEYDNMTAYTINGKTIRAGDYPTTGPHNCWKWAQKVYKDIWGVNFGSDFKGSASKGYNLVRNLTDSERELNPENLQYIISHAKAGATLRVQSCPSGCSGFNTDGCGSHEKHSLIIAEIRDNGLVTMDDQGYGPHTRFYTWADFCKAWAKWKYVKYVKWPNAPALDPAGSVDGYRVSDCSDTYRVRATATKGVGIYSLPENGKLLGTIKYPETFAASKKAIKKIDDCTWVYGKSSTGVTGWLALTDSVADVNAEVKVTGITLSQTKLALLKGQTATLKASVTPEDATSQSVTWSTSDTGVATVDGGVVTGVGGGTATITAASADGSVKAACTVVVAAADVSKTLSKKGSNGTVKLQPGQQLLLNPKFATKKGWKVKSYISSKKKVATVSRAGIVTANAAGTATITVKTRNGKKATVKVKVIDPSVPTKIYLSKGGTVKLKKGATLQLYTKIKPDTATSDLIWASSNKKIATVDDTGKVTAVKKGKCKIGVKTVNGGKTATVKIKVY